MNDSTSSDDVAERVDSIADAVQRSARTLAHQGPAAKNDALASIAQALRDRTDAILEANAEDCERAADEGYDEAFVDRLRLDDARIDKMAADVEEVADLPDPVGSVDDQWVRPNGLRVGRQRIPLGVVGLIYESRPNVTSDAASLCLKSGNGILLKGGSAAFESNRAIHSTIERGIAASSLPEAAGDAVGFVDTRDRAAVDAMLDLDGVLDVIIPRGGSELISLVTEHSSIPVIKHDAGVCHVVVDGSAPAEQVDDIVLNAKTQRTSVCNAAETLLVMENAVDTHLDRLLEKLADAGVTLHLDGISQARFDELDLDAAGVEAADDEAFRREFLSLELAVKVVEGIDDAMDHIAEYGSRHTEAIVTDDYSQSRRFVDEVDSSVVLVNASTRFSDGNQLGLGAEIGISTTRLHAYGPMGLRELTTTKFVVFGDGQIRT